LEWNGGENVGGLDECNVRDEDHAYSRVKPLAFDAGG